MPTARCRSAREGRRAATLVLVLLLSGVASCSLPFDNEDPVQPDTTAEVSAGSAVKQVLVQRARAIRTGSLTGFLKGIDDSRPKFVERQRRFFLNLQELPLGVFTYALQDGGFALQPDGSVQSVVRKTMQLEGYDARPVHTAALFTFVHKPDGSWVLAEDHDRAFEIDNDIELQPWDLMRIEVEQENGVLGVFDSKSINAAYQIMGAVERGIGAVGAEVPLDWSHRVVVYALSDLRMLKELDNLPGGDPERLDGVAFPVRAGPNSRVLASTRFMLHPRMIYRSDETRSRLIRHELTHVAIGRRDDRVPTWLAEGLAEYVSVQAIPPYERMISRDALDEARQGLDSLPEDHTFNGPHSGANYGIAWYACEYITATFDEDTLWRLLDAMRAGNGTAEDEQDSVLLDVLGIDSHELAKRAARKIVNTFG